MQTFENLLQNNSTKLKNIAHKQSLGMRVEFVPKKQKIDKGLYVKKTYSNHFHVIFNTHDKALKWGL